MHKITAGCPAKLNLTFDITGELPGGYHEIDTLFQAVDLEDEMTFEFAPAEQTELKVVEANGSAGGLFPLDESNLICRAARQLLRSLPEAPPVSMVAAVRKRIPMGAGLAGGSSNAAATLLALNYYLGHPLGLEELLVAAGHVGADVPFFLEGGTCLGRRRGDELSVVRHSTRLNFLIVKPAGLSIGTPWAYSAFDDFAGEIPPVDSMVAAKALEAGDLVSAAAAFGNAFEPVVFSVYPRLAEIQQRLLKLGAWCCHLTGKGPTLYALVPDRQAAHALRRRLKDELAADPSAGRPDEVDCFIAESVAHGARLTGESR